MKVAVIAAAMVAATIGCPVASASPVDFSCVDIGGVFVAHYADGRGDCMPADQRHKCHIPPDEQDAFDPTGNYVAEVVMTPPYPAGRIPAWSVSMLKDASNADCWKLPPTS